MGGRHAWDHGISYKWPNSTDFRKSAKQEFSSSWDSAAEFGKIPAEMSMKVLEREIEKSRSTNLASSSDESSFSLNRKPNHTVRPAHELRIILVSALVALRVFCSPSISSRFGPPPCSSASCVTWLLCCLIVGS
jgi:hypothetical protein